MLFLYPCFYTLMNQSCITYPFFSIRDTTETMKNANLVEIVTGKRHINILAKSTFILLTKHDLCYQLTKL